MPANQKESDVFGWGMLCTVVVSDEDYRVGFAAAVGSKRGIGQRDTFAGIFCQFKQLENLLFPLDPQRLVQNVPVIELVRTQSVFQSRQLIPVEYFLS